MSDLINIKRKWGNWMLKICEWRSESTKIKIQMFEAELDRIQRIGLCDRPGFQFWKMKVRFIKNWQICNNYYWIIVLVCAAKMSFWLTLIIALFLLGIIGLLSLLMATLDYFYSPTEK